MEILFETRVFGVSSLQQKKHPIKKHRNPLHPESPQQEKQHPEKTKQNLTNKKRFNNPPQKNTVLLHIFVSSHFSKNHSAVRFGPPRPSQISLLRVTLLIVDGLDGMEAQVKLCGLFWGMMS